MQLADYHPPRLWCTDWEYTHHALSYCCRCSLAIVRNRLLVSQFLLLCMPLNFWIHDHLLIWFSLFTGEDHLSGFLSVRDVTTSATHLYDDVATRLDKHIFYPELRFTCSGNITKITFIGEKRETVKDVDKYLRFSTWSTKGHDVDFNLTSLNKNTLIFNLSNSSIIDNGTGNLSIYQVLLGEKDQLVFEDGDIFGIRQTDSNRSKVALLHQVGGGHSYEAELDSSTFHTRVFVTSVLQENNSYPLIAIETGKLDSSHVCLHIIATLTCS